MLTVNASNELLFLYCTEFSLSTIIWICRCQSIRSHSDHEIGCDIESILLTHDFDAANNFFVVFEVRFAYIAIAAVDTKCLEFILLKI